MTDDELQRIKELDAARTPGEWHFDEAQYYAVADSKGVFVGVSHGGDADEQDEKDAHFISSCSTAVPAMIAEIERLQQAIRKHRDQRGDDRCWLDDETLYAVLPEGYTPPERDCSVELSLCEKYIASRHNPKTTYVSPQRRIEELEAEIERLKAENEDLRARCGQ